MNSKRKKTLSIGALAVAASYAVSFLTCKTYCVKGSSMSPAVYDGDRVVVSLFPYLPNDDSLSSLESKLVVVRIYGETIIKRLTAGPGDLVTRRDGSSYRLQSSECWLVGDNHRVSVDSNEFGPARSSDLIGRVVCSFRPGFFADAAHYLLDWGVK